MGTLLLCALLTGCDSPPPAKRPDPTTATTATTATVSAAAAAATNPPLAAARIDLAKARLGANAPAEALSLLVSALAAEPKSVEAKSLAAEILSTTRWHLAELTLEHHCPIERIDILTPSALWAGLAGGTSTTVRWNLETLKIEAVLFPLQTAESRSWVRDPTGRAVVVERAGVTLLCNAQSLKPICELGPLPDLVTPAAVVVFSADGLLAAHPAVVSPGERSWVWHLRDAASGQIIRSSEARTADQARPLAAFLDRRELRVLHADGSVFTMPVSPVEANRLTPPAEPITLLHAQFAATGNAALALKDQGPHRRPQSFLLSYGGANDTSLDPASLLERFAWSRHPNVWTGLLRDAEPPPLAVTDRSVCLLGGHHAPIHTASAITAVAVSGERILIGETTGTLTIQRTLPLPAANPAPPPATDPDQTALAALRNLTEALAGISYDEPGRSFRVSDQAQRLSAFRACDFAALQRVFPALDFSPLATMMQSFTPRTAGPEALQPLTERLARALPPATGLPAQLEIERIFETNETTAIEAAIRTAGGKGPAAAKALELALASTRPEWIESSLGQAADLPPLLRKIAASRIAWLQDRKADALAGWPDEFPELADVRRREDWDGWEQADFSQALEKLRLGVGEELAAIEVPENPTPEQRKAIAARLSDPATLQTVGRARFAHACLKAALALASFKEETATTFLLASRARDLGEDPAPCLRAEAISLTALGDYQQAHARWITLITEHPVASQLPGDYAEASYTAFENADPRQAMAILTTGLHRFPNDANFALRAGWVALLTGNAERAYRFLLTGRQIGYPPDKLENATALLAIAAAQTGAAEDAAAFYQDLILLDPAWAKPETLESLEWPEDLKATLRQLVW